MSKRQLNPNDLADQLDVRIPPGQTGFVPHPNGDDPLIEAALQLTQARHPQLSAQSMQRIHQQMLAAQSAQQRRFFRPTTYMLAAACMILVLLFVNPLIADSLPGDTLYPAKRAFERVELAAARLVQNDVPVRLKHAERRVDEAVVLVDAGQFDTELVDEALQQVSQVAAAVEPEDIQAIQNQVQQINSQLDYVVAAAQAENLAAESTLAEMTTRIQRVRETNPVLFAVPQQPVTPPDETPTPTPTATLTVPASVTATVTAGSSPTWTPTTAPTMTTVPDTSVTPQPQQTRAFVTGTSRVNVRQGPGLNFPVIAQAAPGDPLTVIGQNAARDWSQIRLGSGVEGWIASTLLYIGDAPPVIPPVAGGGSEDDPGSEGNRPDCPGNSCNAPGQTGDLPQPPGPGDCPGNSCNPPGNPDPPGGGRNNRP